jgi:hypothetical protein
VADLGALGFHVDTFDNDTYADTNPAGAKADFWTRLAISP